MRTLISTSPAVTARWHSDEMHVVERLTLSADGNQLMRNYDVTDAKFLAAPVTGTSSWTRSTLQVSRYNCTELSGVNNLRPKTAGFSK